MGITLKGLSKKIKKIIILRKNRGSKYVKSYKSKYVRN